MKLATIPCTLAKCNKYLLIAIVVADCKEWLINANGYHWLPVEMSDCQKKLVTKTCGRVFQKLVHALMPQGFSKVGTCINAKICEKIKSLCQLYSMRYSFSFPIYKKMVGDPSICQNGFRVSVLLLLRTHPHSSLYNERNAHPR